MIKYDSAKMEEIASSYEAAQKQFEQIKNGMDQEVDRIRGAWHGNHAEKAEIDLKSINNSMEEIKNNITEINRIINDVKNNFDQLNYGG